MRTLSVLAVAVVFTVDLGAQQRLRTGLGGAQIIGSDLAIFEAHEQREDLRCKVHPDKEAAVGFDLRFHANFDVDLPLDELEGAGNVLSILFRVTAADKPNEPVYFTQRIKVPEITENAKGDVLLQGGFDMGEGKYKVEWLMRDSGERVCSDNWEVEATLDRGEREIKPSLIPGTIEAIRPTDFAAENAAESIPPVPAPPIDRPLSLKILMNFAPQHALASALRPIDTQALTSILRTLARDTRIGKVALVAFNLNEEKVIYRQAAGQPLNLPALGESLKSLNFGTIDIHHMIDKMSNTRFLADLIEAEVMDDTVDAVVFAGPKAYLEKKVPTDQLKPLAPTAPPLFYLNYATNPFAMPWRDTIGEAVKTLRGVEYTISRPRDLWTAVTEMVGQIAKSRNEKAPGSVSYK